MTEYKFYKFYIQNPEKARAEFRTWTGRVDINIQKTINDGFIIQYTRRPEEFAARIGGATFEQIAR